MRTDAARLAGVYLLTPDTGDRDFDRVLGVVDSVPFQHRMVQAAK